MHCGSVSNCLAVSLLTESMTFANHHVYFCHFSNKLTQKNTLKKKSKYLTQQLTSVRSLGIVNWLQTRKTIWFQLEFLEKSVNKVDGASGRTIVAEPVSPRPVYHAKSIRQCAMYFWWWRVLAANLFISLSRLGVRNRWIFPSNLQKCLK